jgi:hypothetical protein
VLHNIRLAFLVMLVCPLLLTFVTVSVLSWEDEAFSILLQARYPQPCTPTPLPTVFPTVPPTVACIRAAHARARRAVSVGCVPARRWRGTPPPGPTQRLGSTSAAVTDPARRPSQELLSACVYMYIVYTFQFLAPLASAPDAGDAGEELPLAEGDDENDANGGSGAAAEGGGAEQRGGGEGGEDADVVEGWVQREGGDVEMVPVPRRRRSEDPGGLPGRVLEEDPSTPSPTAPARMRSVQGRD